MKDLGFYRQFTKIKLKQNLKAKTISIFQLVYIQQL